MVSVTLTPPTIVQNESFLLPLLHNPSIFILIHIIKHSLRGLQLSLLMHSSLTTTPGEGGEREEGERREEGGRREGGEKEERRRREGGGREEGERREEGGREERRRREGGGERGGRRREEGEEKERRKGENLEYIGQVIWTLPSTVQTQSTVVLTQNLFKLLKLKLMLP